MMVGDRVIGVVAVSFLGQSAALVYIARLTRESIRIGRGVAALVYQEEDKTCALIRELGRPDSA